MDGKRAILGKDHRNLYECYLTRQSELGVPWCKPTMSFLEYARLVRYDSATGKVVPRYADIGREAAIGVNYAFELYDHYVGQFVAMNYPHTINHRNTLCAAPGTVPENTRFLSGAIESAVTPGGAINDAIRRRVEGGGDASYFAPMFTDEETMSDPSAMRRMALEFLLRDMVADLKLCGLKKARLWTFTQRLNAIHLLLEAHAGRLRAFREDLPAVSMIDASQWDLKHRDTMPDRTWSEGQKRLLQLISEGVKIDDANVYSDNPFSRFIFASGEPGAGKSEAVVYAAYAAAQAGAHVLIGCPTGVLVSGYLDRLPPHSRICCETIHSAWKIGRTVDCDKYNPPSRLRRYELFIIDEVGFLDNDVGRVLIRAILELPQKPLVVFVGDLSQLQPIRGGEYMRNVLLYDAMTTVELEQHAFARTQDPILLDFLHDIRTAQPTKKAIREFFGDRYLGFNLATAVARCLTIRGRDETPVTWLTCINKGAMEVNYEYLRQLGYGTKESITTASDAYRCDVDYGGEPMIVRPGMWLRLTRNLDKRRGFCNGAMGQVVDVLHSDGRNVIFTMRLTHGTMVIVHPIQIGDDCFLPCVYGYAMTTRKAQGSSVDYAVLYFDLFKPAPRGFAYVGASRVRTSAGLFYFGKIRRSDWLPVGGDPMNEQVTRGADSSDSSESGRAPSIDESSDDDCGLSMGEDSGMDSMAGSVASMADMNDLLDVEDSVSELNDLLDVEDSVSESMSDCAASESTEEAMVDALAQSREPMLESECVRNLLS